MNRRFLWRGFHISAVRNLVAILCIVALLPGETWPFAEAPQTTAAPAEEAAATLPPDQLDSLVAPIALYPDSLLSQILVASTYPLEIIQLQQWMEKNKNLKDKALADAVQKQDWDPSVQALAALPDAVKQLAENIKWTTDLGNAFLAQQSDVMDAVQRMRAKAKNTGNLKSSEQQKVETQVIEKKEVIVIQSANPEVIYVPSYNPTVVYGAPAYPYPPIAYPPPGYYAAGMAISFGIGIAMGAAWGGCCGWNAGWGGNNVVINNNNNFVRNSNRNVSNRTARAGNSNWQHNPRHRGGTPYSNRDTANRFGGSTRGDSRTARRDDRQAGRGDRGGLERASDRGPVGDRQGGNRDRSNLGDRQGAGDRGGAGDRAGAANRGDRGGAGSGNRGSNGGDRVGNRSVSGGGGRSGSSGAFGGGSGGFNGGSAKASSSRGASSMGGSRGGGGGGGGRRSGGGGGRRR